MLKKTDSPLPMKGTGAPLRQFLYNEDAGQIILMLLKLPPENLKDVENVILSPPAETEVTIRRIAELISENTGLSKSVAWDPSFADGQYQRTVDNSELSKLIGKDFPFMKIEDGIKNVVEWFAKNFE
eukprot:Platyproteum_vivax@DN8539_c0_g1_i1.p1